VIDRRVFLIAVAGGVLIAPRRGAAQGTRMARLGVLTGASDARAPKFDAFRQGLRELGYVEGENLALEYRFAHGDLHRFPALAAELVQLGVDVIVTDGGNAAPLAARQATQTIPIVMAVSGDPLQGLIASFARPGANVTGLTLLSPELSAKRLQFLTEIVPRAARIAVLHNAGNPGSLESLAATERAASTIGVKVERFEVRDRKDLASVLASVARERPHAFLSLADVTFFDERARIVDAVNRHRIPAMFPEREFADAGGLSAYGPDVPANFRRAATYVHKILKGASPATLPVEQPTKVELLVNLKTARALGLTIPHGLLLRADHVLQ
jgi:putative ABC transport system substrate-binding protein